MQSQISRFPLSPLAVNAGASSDARAYDARRASTGPALKTDASACLQVPTQLIGHRDASPSGSVCSLEHSEAHSATTDAGSSRYLHDVVDNDDTWKSIQAPTTWSQLVGPELVENLSDRERTRQEVLWEVVASEERYAADLRSIVHHFSMPLLHPSTHARQSIAPLQHLPRPSIPVAIERPTSAADRHRQSSTWTALVPTHSSRSSSAHSSHPDYGNLEQHSRSRKSGRLSSLSFLSSKMPRSRSSSTPEPSTYSASDLPLALDRVLRSIERMAQGHADLSQQLRIRWQEEFPLARSLTALWASQEWFMLAYTDYVISLEECLQVLSADTNRPPAKHRPVKPVSTMSVANQNFRARLRALEEDALEEGEASLRICLLKPLMRLAQLPLLLQSLLFHSDPTLHGWEQTQGMSTAIADLVRELDQLRVRETRRAFTDEVLLRVTNKPEHRPEDVWLVSESRINQAARALWKKRVDEWSLEFSDGSRWICVRTGSINTASAPLTGNKHKRNLYRFVRREDGPASFSALADGSVGLTPSVPLSDQPPPAVLEAKHGHKLLSRAGSSSMGTTTRLECNVSESSTYRFEPFLRTDSRSHAPQQDDAQERLVKHDSSADLLKAFWAQEEAPSL
ncbi:hypothetical protein ACM66B_001058 [Microbotryomycetes sp. NB124-2]